MDINDLETILKTYEITPEHFDHISKDPHFIEVLKASIIEWQGATNTEQRIKFKSAALLEMWLEEANARLHDKAESLSAKVELAKFLGRLNDLGTGSARLGSEAGEKFNITINLGADAQLKFEKQLPARVIEHDPTQKEP